MAKKRQSKSVVVSARLNTKFPEEAEALRVLADLEKGGWERREIITNALLRLAGKEPHAYSREVSPLDELNAKLDAMMSIFESSMGDILLAIKQSDPHGLQRFAEAEPDADGKVEFSDEFIQNSQRAARRSFRQQQDE